MQTEHRVHVGDSRHMDELETDAVDLVVTSPPYPMIEMWDEVFTDLDPSIKPLLEDGSGRAAFESMHETLDEIWREVSRVLVDGGIACINVGDATRKLDDSFKVYQNHARIIDAFVGLGFDPLPEILWRKPVNSGTKFMGSGMLPPNAYATLEHEYILVFRNGGDRRSFEPKADRRYRAAYFWEERNEWFSDVWMDIRGTVQDLDTTDLRDRSGAFPVEIPYRLINMYSVYEDTVLDPFFGTGTTSLAAMVAGRNSVGYELEDEFSAVFDDRVAHVDTMSEEILTDRIQRHRAFVDSRLDEGESVAYDATNYDFPVMTKQETEIQFYAVNTVERAERSYVLAHTEYNPDTASTPRETLDRFTTGSDAT